MSSGRCRYSGPAALRWTFRDKSEDGLQRNEYSTGLFNGLIVTLTGHALQWPYKPIARIEAAVLVSEEIEHDDSEDDSGAVCHQSLHLPEHASELQTGDAAPEKKN